MTSPVRAFVEVEGFGAIEANPFGPNGFTRGGWPDGRHSKEQRHFIKSNWTVEREATGWVARASIAQVPLVVDHTVRLGDHGGGLVLTLRARDAPLFDPRLRIGSDLDLIDAPWALSSRCPRRLGAWRGQLVEVLCHSQGRPDPSLRRDDEPIDELLKQGVLAYAARFDVPLRWLDAAGVETPVDDIHRYVVGLDGTLREIPVGIESFTRRAFPVIERRPLFAGVVEGLFPERVREWRELTEQVALL